MTDAARRKVDAARRKAGEARRTGDEEPRIGDRRVVAPRLGRTAVGPDDRTAADSGGRTTAGSGDRPGRAGDPAGTASPSGRAGRSGTAHPIGRDHPVAAGRAVCHRRGAVRRRDGTRPDVDFAARPTLLVDDRALRLAATAGPRLRLDGFCHRRPARTANFLDRDAVDRIGSTRSRPPNECRSRDAPAWWCPGTGSPGAASRHASGHRTVD